MSATSAIAVSPARARRLRSSTATTASLARCTLAGQDVSGDKFLNEPSNRPAIDETMGVAMSGDCANDPSEQGKPDPKAAMHFVTGVPKSGSPLKFGPGAPPQLAAFVIWRDSTRGMVFSRRRVIRQIYAALRRYEEAFKVTPGVILVTQSFGGLASRFMLSRPEPATLTPLLNAEKVALCKEDLAKMDYIRDRTLFLTTLATPHEGSYLAELGAVHSASALGFTWGKEPFSFEHDRKDEKKQLGSWYRLHDNPVTEKYNHGLPYGQDVGVWVRDTLLKPEIGPVPAEKTFGVWTQGGPSRGETASLSGRSASPSRACSAERRGAWWRLAPGEACELTKRARRP